MNKKIGIAIAGVVIGVSALLLTKYGNPANMGLCIACFLRDISGALGFHQAAVVQYIRPEIIGIVIGAFIISLATKEFKAVGGSSPITRFFIGIAVMIGALVFLGCPLRMMLRIGGGDLNAVVGLLGFIGGIGLGIFCLNKGFSLKRAHKQTTVEGTIFPALMIGLFVMLLSAPVFIYFSESGPGSMHAPIILSLIVGLVVGALAQRTRLCTVGSVRDTIMFKDTYLITGFIAIILTVIVGNLIMGNFNLSFAGQPVAHTDGLWNFLGMALVGWGSVLIGGCPLRQLVLAGQGNSDSAITVIGMIVGAAICHNFKLASSADGPTPNGKIAVVIMLILVGIIALVNIFKAKSEQKGENPIV